MFLFPTVRIGLELSGGTLRLASVTRGLDGKTRWAFREQRCPDDATPEVLRQELARLLQPLRRSRFTARLILASPDCTIRQLTLEATDTRRVAEAVRSELPAMLPFEAERAQVQFRVQHQRRVEERVEAVVSVAACDGTALRSDLDLLWQSGWAVDAVAPAALALVQAARSLHVLGEEPAMLMDVGARRTTIVFVDGGDVVYARDVTLGDEHLTDALMGHVSSAQGTISLSRADAEAMKQRLGIPDPAASAPGSETPASMPAATYLALLQPVLEQLAGECRRTMAFGANRGAIASPLRIVVSGQGAKLPRIDQWLAKELGVPAARLNCERWLGAEGATAAIACGLALCERPLGLDLQPRAARQRGGMARLAAVTWRAAAAACLAVWLGTAWWGLRHGAAARELAAVEARWNAVAPVAELQERLDADARLLATLVATQSVPAAWFQRLGQGFPNPVRLAQLSVDGEGQIAMAGQAQARDQTPEAQVSALALWLEQGVCRGVQLGTSQRVGTEENLAEFSLTCHLP